MEEGTGMTPKEHYSEADLLETYYTQPGQSMPVMMHLADCADCAARYERLEKKMAGLRSCHREEEKNETFWRQQRASVMRKVAERRASPSVLRVAAAAILAFILGGILTYRSVDHTQPRTTTAAVETASAAATTATTTTGVPVDPWQTDELKDFQSLVAWESWDDSNAATRKAGDTSL